MGANTWLGTALIATVISAMVTALGWYVAASRERARERRRRRERELDVQLALRAEIRAHAHQLNATDFDAHLADRLARMEAEEGFAPFVPRETNDLVFRAMVAEIHILPSRVVDPVVLYYHQIAAIGSVAEDLREERFAGLDRARKAAAFSHFIAMKKLARFQAGEAIAALNASIAEISMEAGSFGEASDAPEAVLSNDAASADPGDASDASAPADTAVAGPADGGAAVSTKDRGRSGPGSAA